MDTTSRFWDKTAPKYARMPIADEDVYQRKLKLTRQYMEPHFDVVEFGCGTGGTAIAHAPHVRKITALDFSAAMLDMAREKARERAVSNVEFVQADIDSYSATPESADMVLALSLLHLLKSPEQAIAKIHAQLKPGGYFVSSTACLSDTPMKVLKYMVPLGKALGLLPHITVFGDADLKKMIETQGFSIVHHWLPGPSKAVFIIARKAG